MHRNLGKTALIYSVVTIYLGLRPTTTVRNNPQNLIKNLITKTFLMCFRVYAIKLTYHSTTEAILLSTLAVLLLQLRAVGTEGRGSGGRSPPNFDQSVKPIPIRRSRLCPPHYYLPPSPKFLNLPTALELRTRL